MRGKRLAIAVTLMLITAFLALNIVLWPFTAYFTGRNNHCGSESMQLLADEAGRSLNIENLPCANSRCLLVTARHGAIPEVRARRLRQDLPAYGVSVPSYGELRGIVVMLHGKGSCKENQVYAALRLSAAGLAVIIPDLPGHGENPASPSGYGVLAGERHIASDALKTARQHLGQNLPAALWGHSMGSSFANYSAAAHPQDFDVLVIQSGFDRMDKLLRDHLATLPDSVATPLIIWFRQLVLWRGGADIAAINPEEAAAAVRIPVLQIHGSIDRLIPYARGQALAAAYHGEKHFITIPDGDHNDALHRATPAYAPTIAFILQHLGENAAP